MNRQIRCAHCKCLFFTNPRVKNQRFCSSRDCQSARKRLWQREKIAIDPDYQQNRRDCQRAWCGRNPDYWKNYRLNHPAYTSRNRELQNVRDKRRSHPGVDLAKMDALEPFFTVKQGTYYLIPDSVSLAKMDASAQKVCLIPVT
jgi:hypothetical protein